MQEEHIYISFFGSNGLLWTQKEIVLQLSLKIVKPCYHPFTIENDELFVYIYDIDDMGMPVLTI
jgi:hypothetical protein